jgi:hypothetical protein
MALNRILIVSQNNFGTEMPNFRPGYASISGFWPFYRSDTLCAAKAAY